ncbi:MAG TPA: peptidase S58 family protein [Deltaproteobacteria bacterium]|nr:peptidase S58 family protein [Deltaproteobacteria bacterium]
MTVKNDTLTAIEGITVGHFTNRENNTGCTVILPANGAVAGVDVRGGAPGTYGTDTLQPLDLVTRVHAIVLTGGSAFGLESVTGVRRYLEEKNVGFNSGYGLVPIVAGAVIFDLGLNPSKKYPDDSSGYQACLNASSDPVEEGCVGAGTGATVGKLYKLDRETKGGLGSCCIHGAKGLKVGALAVANPFGDVIDPSTGKILAGVRTKDGKGFSNARKLLQKMDVLFGFPDGSNTVLGVVVTNASFNKTQLTKIAQMAHDGIARTVNPSHTMYDGDTIFALSTEKISGFEVSIVGALAAEAMANAILRAIKKAKRCGKIPASGDLIGD